MSSILDHPPDHRNDVGGMLQQDAGAALYDQIGGSRKVWRSEDLMSTVVQPITADELLRMPRGKSRHELVKGELLTMSPAGGEHGAVIGTLFMLLGMLGWDQYAGKVEVVTDYFASSGTGQINAIFPLPA